MSNLQTTRERLHPATEDDVRLVRAELRTVLESPHFTTSKRYPAFLAYVVEKTLEGRGDELKERTLGVEVFHRRSDYDTNSDTIVRFAAGEVRKRLALIYHESDADHPLQIALSPGSYIPEFLRLHAATPEPAVAASADGMARPEIAPPPRPTPATEARPPLRGWMMASLLLIVLASMGLGVLIPSRMLKRKDAVDAFWQPFMDGTQPTLLCPGALVSSERGMVQAGKSDEYPYISMTTAGTITRLATMFGNRSVPYLLQPASATTLTDIRQHPVVMIGAYNNDWTIRLLSDLRFRFAPQVETAIYDSANPSRRWSRPAGASYDEGDDYAVIARFHDRLTENVVVVIAGIGKNGTEAAAQFATSDQYLKLLNGPQSKDWATRNLEVVIKSSVVASKTGAPSIEAVYVW